MEDFEINNEGWLAPKRSLRRIFFLQGENRIIRVSS